MIGINCVLVEKIFIWIVPHNCFYSLSFTTQPFALHPIAAKKSGQTWIWSGTWWRHLIEHFLSYWDFVRWIYHRLNKQLGKQWRCQWFETPARSFWRHSNEIHGQRPQLLLEIRMVWQRRHGVANHRHIDVFQQLVQLNNKDNYNGFISQRVSNEHGVSMSKHRQGCVVIAAYIVMTLMSPIARFMGPTWGPSGADRTKVGPMLAPWNLLSGVIFASSLE